MIRFSGALIVLCLSLSQSFTLLKATEAGDVRLYDNLGTYSRGITTDSHMAQKYFDQGMQLAYGFGRSAAVESFRKAQEFDSDCAMCYWGEAWALGPYQNSRMEEEAAHEAYRAAQRALKYSGRGTAVEQALIRALARRYVEEPDQERRELDQNYADAMRKVVREFPLDPDAVTLMAESLMVLHPWDLWLEDGKPRPETREAIDFLERVLAREITHAGACHLYIHAVEASAAPGRAEDCADLLAGQMPGVSHIQHMPSHIYMRLGRYGDAVRANQQAHLVDQKAEKGLALAVYSAHNLHMLVFAGWMDGQSAVALQAARDLARNRTEDAFQYPLMLVRFGRWQEVLENRETLDDPFQDAFWHYARGVAHLRQGNIEEAEVHLARLKRIEKATPEEEHYRNERFRKVDLLRIARGILAGEIEARQGEAVRAIEVLKEAMAVEDSLAYSEPENWPIPVRQVLGAVLLALNRAGEAEEIYRQDLQNHPANGWSLLGLAQSLEAQGRKEEALVIRQQFERAWTRSDVFLTSSRF